MATLYKADGTQSEVTPSKKKFSLEELQSFVGGCIDIRNLPSGQIMVINDEGKLDGLPRNQHASELWQKEYPISEYPINNDGLIVGDVIVLAKAERKLL